MDPSPSRRIVGDLRTEDIARLQSDCVLEGSLHARGGVILGERVTIRGNIYTEGRIAMAPGCRVEGRINPVAGNPNDLGPEANAMAAPEQEEEMRSQTIRATLGVLFDLAADGYRRGAQVEDDHWWGLERGAADDLAKGLLELASRKFRGGDPEKPWISQDIFDILLPQVAGLLVPIRVVRRSGDEGEIEVGSPHETLPGWEDLRGWPVPVLSLISLLGRAAHSGFRMDPVQPDEVLDPEHEPARVSVHVTLRQPIRHGPAPGRR